MLGSLKLLNSLCVLCALAPLCETLNLMSEFEKTSHEGTKARRNVLC